NLPAKLFLNTQIPACLWFLNRNTGRKRKSEILFIDARNQGHLINRRTKELSEEDIQTVAKTYHNWCMGNGEYSDIAGFCKSATLDAVRILDYVLTPGRYIGLPEEEDDFVFAERFAQLKAQLEEQMLKEEMLNRRIRTNLVKIQEVGND